MAVNINGETLTITLESGISNIDWVDVYSDWKDWLLEGNLKYPPAFRTTGGDPLNSFLNSGSYWFLRNDLGWRIKPPEEHITILASGNLAAENADIDMFIPTTGAYTTQILGLQPITQGFSAQLADGLKFGFFNNRVTIDAINGIAGTGDTPGGEPIGTLKNPSNNLADTMTIASNQGIGIISVVGDITVDSGADYSDMVFIGESHEKTVITVSGPANVERCEFYSATVAGALDGNAVLDNCMIGDLTYVNGEIRECVLKPPGIITLGGSDYATFVRCVTECTAGGPPVTIDMGGEGMPLALRDLSGAFKLMNKTGTEECSAVMAGGAIYLDLVTMTNGKFKVSGTCDVYDWATKLPLESGSFGSFELVNNAISKSGITHNLLNEELSEYLVSGSVGMQFIHIAYANRIVIDEVNGNPGSVPFHGICDNPVNNWADAMILADLLDINVFHIHGDSVVPATINLNDAIVESHGSLDRTLTLTSGCTTNGTIFRGLILEGYLTGNVFIHHCEVLDLTGFKGTMDHGLISGDIVCAESSYKSTIEDCKSGGGADSWPTVDVNGAPIAIRNYYGNLEILGKDETNDIEIVFSFGLVKISETCIAGIIKLLGNARVVEDNSGINCTVDDSDLLSLTNIANTVWNGITLEKP